MTRHEKTPARLLPKVLLRVLPVTVLVLLGTWFVASQAVTRAISTELHNALDREAQESAKQISLKLNTVISAAEGLASNDLVINGLIDIEGRANYVSVFFQSFRVPGPVGGRATLIDYRGRVIASNQPETNYESAPWIERSMDGETFIDISANGILIAVPVFYSGQPEGVVVVEHNPENLKKLLVIPTVSRVIEIWTEAGVALSVSDKGHVETDHQSADTKHPDWVTVEANIPGFPELRLLIAEQKEIAFATADRLGRYMLAALVLSILAITGGLLATAYLATRPLNRFIGTIEKLTGTQNFDYRMAPFGSAEFHALTHSFNHMLEELENTTLSRDYVDNVLNSITEMLLVTSTGGLIRTANQAFLKARDCTIEEIEGLPISSIVETDTESQDSLLVNTATTKEGILRKKNGQGISIQISASHLNSDNIDTSDVIYVLSDITERKWAESALRNSEARSRAVIETAVDGVILIDQFGSVLTFNPACEELFGFSAKEVTGRNVNMLMPAPYHDEHDGYLDHYNETGERKIIGIGREVMGRRKDGTEFPLELSVGKAQEGDQPIFVGIVRDITARKWADAALHNSEARARAVIETAVDGVILIDQFGSVLTFNPACEELFGFSAKEVTGRNVNMLMPPPYHDEHDGYLDHYSETGERKIIGIGREVMGRRKDGTEFPLELSVGKAQEGDQPIFVGIVRDITERKRVAEELEALAQYDVLTGLANRSLFHARLDGSIAQAKRTSQMVAVMLLDLDHFKDVNDSLGHPVGDALLIEIAERLTANTRETDTVARLGGDEFAVIATNLGDFEGAAFLAGKLVEAVAVPFQWDGQEIQTGTSIGISVYPLEVGDPDELLKHADFALYQAKNEGRGTWQFYDAEMNAERRAQKSIESDLAQALDRNEFTLFYQPKIHVSTGEVTGVEALIRWTHPEYGMMPPNEFISIAETTGQIVSIGAWVVRTVCAQHLAWRESGLPPIPIAINLSAVQFRDGNLPALLRSVMAEFGLNPGYFELEITEGVIVENTESVTSQFRQMRALGHTIAIDDFGTGYSSLAYLKRFPVDKLKIDRAFVSNITSDADDAAIIKGIIALAKTLNMAVVAEGVETEDQLEFLRQHECEEVQGYLYTAPISAGDFAAWYREHTDLLTPTGPNNLKLITPDRASNA